MSIVQARSDIREYQIPRGVMNLDKFENDVYIGMRDLGSPCLFWPFRPAEEDAFPERRHHDEDVGYC